ncbi:MAG TPA: hypothetical protein DEP53_16135 [Bacteroidetes bacterium]|nr:MAG: hypothetical protein A2X66_01825 [Ignavibacteria bacterium GWA2_54_16]HCA81259.1 hypothetical protein [Bacteroidota bacterium]
MSNGSKIVLVGATTLLVGIYTVALKQAQLTDIVAADQIGQISQTERVTDAAFRAAVYRVQTNVKTYRDLMGNMSALSIAATKTALGENGGTYTYNLYVPYAGYNATGTVTVTVPVNKGLQDVRALQDYVRTYSVEVKRVNGTGSLATGTKPGYRTAVRGQWQLTRYQLN